MGEADSKADHGLIISRSVSLALASSFDSGGLQIEPNDFEDVIAVSSGDSLYVSKALLSDPAEAYQGIRSLVGDERKPGMALLSCPRDPVVEKPGDEAWEMVKYHDFDGEWKYNLRSNSFHLKLTGYKYPINIGQHGTLYGEVPNSEVVVSAQSRRQWVADINVLSLYTKKDESWARHWLGERLLPRDYDHDEGPETTVKGLTFLHLLTTARSFLTTPKHGNCSCERQLEC